MIYGHEKKVDFFKNLISRGILGHAYLFFGEPQIGKHYFAKHLAYFLEYGEFEILEKPFLDTVFVEPEGNEKIGIDRIREMRKFLFQRPFRSNKRLVILDKAGFLTPEAQAGLLKFVEEAPSHVTFIFIAEDPQSLLPPLVSRLQKIYFSRLSSRELRKVLEKEYDLPESKAKEVSKESFGRLGRALDIMNGENDNDENLEKFIEKKIIALFLKDKFKNAGLIKWLVDREMKVKRFTLNPKLQRKVIEYKLRA